MTRGEKTKNKILNAGMKMWLRNPDSVTANAVAKKLGITHGAILYHFPQGMKQAVAEHAITVSENRIVAQLIASGSELVNFMSREEKIRVLASL